VTSVHTAHHPETMPEVICNIEREQLRTQNYSNSSVMQMLCLEASRRSLCCLGLASSSTFAPQICLEIITGFDHFVARPS